MVVEILKYHVVGDGAAGGREIASGPEMASPVTLPDRGKLLLDASRRTPLDPAHDIAQRMPRRHTDEHMHVIPGQYALDDLDAEFRAGLANNLPNTTLQLAAKDAVAIFGRPDDVITVAVKCMTTLAVDHDRAPREGEIQGFAISPSLGARSWTSLPHAKAVRLKDEGLGPNHG